MRRHYAHEFAIEEAWEDGTEIPPSVEPLAQSVLAEALRNAAKHGRPSAVRVRVARSDGALVVEVANDGVRGRPGPGGGMGLRLAAFEALQHGGVLEFGAPDKGSWQVRLVVPGNAG
jgi:signal transduction histidine kinase